MWVYEENDFDKYVSGIIRIDHDWNLANDVDSFTATTTYGWDPPRVKWDYIKVSEIYPEHVTKSDCFDDVEIKDYLSEFRIVDDDDGNEV